MNIRGKTETYLLKQHFQLWVYLVKQTEKNWSKAKIEVLKNQKLTN